MSCVCVCVSRERESNYVCRKKKGEGVCVGEREGYVCVHACVHAQQVCGEHYSVCVCVVSV